MSARVAIQELLTSILNPIQFQMSRVHRMRLNHKSAMRFRPAKTAGRRDAGP